MTCWHVGGDIRNQMTQHSRCSSPSPHPGDMTAPCPLPQPGLVADHPAIGHPRRRAEKINLWRFRSVSPTINNVNVHNELDTKQTAYETSLSIMQRNFMPRCNFRHTYVAKPHVSITVCQQLPIAGCYSTHGIIPSPRNL